MSYRIAIGIAALAAGLFFASGFSPSRQAIAAGDDDQAIQKRSDAYANAFNKGDVSGIMSFWSTDAEYVDESGKCTKGHDALKEMFSKSLLGNKGIKVQIKTSTIRLLKGDIALQEGNAVLTRADGVPETSPFTAAWIKQDGQWLLHLVRDLSVPSGAVADDSPSHLKDLAWLAGDWIHEEQGTTTTLKGHWMTGQKFLILDYVVRSKGEEVLSIHQIIGWDPTANKLHSWVFDTRGGFGEGAWSRHGDTWNVEVAGITSDGRRGNGANKWTLVDENSFTFQAVDREVNGQPLPDKHITYRRAKAK
jgi:uncharacterized protein (TIGR02246 family)